MASLLAAFAMTKPMRLAMPTVARWIDDLRAAWGTEQIDQAIRAGMNGQPTFYAAENGQQIGSRPSPAPENIISLADCQIGPINPANAPQAARKGNRHG